MLSVIVKFCATTSKASPSQLFAVSLVVEEVSARFSMLGVVRESETTRAVKRISGLIYEETRAVLKNFLEGVSSMVEERRMRLTMG